MIIDVEVRPGWIVDCAGGVLRELLRATIDVDTRFDDETIVDRSRDPLDENTGMDDVVRETCNARFVSMSLEVRPEETGVIDVDNSTGSAVELELGLLVTVMNMVDDVVVVVVEKRSGRKSASSESGARASSASARSAITLVQLLWRVFRVQYGLLRYAKYSCGLPTPIGLNPCPIT
jgi:hypothetical protein